MNLLSRFLNDAYVALLGSAINCCPPKLQDERPPVRGIEKPMTILHHQPRLIPPPRPEPQRPSIQGSSRGSSREWVTITKSLASRASRRTSFSVKRRLNAYNGPRRPRIGSPTDFRHVQSSLTTRQTDRFRPLELSIYMPENQLSPILPHFNVDDSIESTMRDRLSQPSAAQMHTRSDSALSNFTIPRKPVNSHQSMFGRVESSKTPFEQEGRDFVTHSLRPRPSLPESLGAQELIAALQDALPRTPPTTRLRANTESAIMRTSEQIKRVKSFLQEKEHLELRLKNIDSIIEERRSIQLSSQNGCRRPGFEDPMPELTKTETGQVSHMHRPNTAPNVVRIPVRAKSFSEASATFESGSAPLPPPLPLVLHSIPPLRKKKSFSRVSNWLFPGDHSRNISLDSVTNVPQPVTSRDVFYQCVDLKRAQASVRSILTFSTLESEVDEPTVPTTWTPDSSPGGAGQRRDDHRLERISTFGQKQEIMNNIERVTHRISSVGVAF